MSRTTSAVAIASTSSPGFGRLGSGDRSADPPPAPLAEIPRGGMTGSPVVGCATGSGDYHGKHRFERRAGRRDERLRPGADGGPGFRRSGRGAVLASGLAAPPASGGTPPRELAAGGSSPRRSGDPTETASDQEDRLRSSARKPPAPRT